MNLLAFDTSTEHLSVAIQRASGEILHVESEGGAKASTTLIPAVLQLLADAGLAMSELDAIVFGKGPGSFTGLRTACSVAQGFSFGSGVPVLGVDTLLAVADEAHSRTGAERIVALLDARMDEVYFASYAFESGRWQEQQAVQLLRPEAVMVPSGWAVAGNAFMAYGGRLPDGPIRIEALPTATAMLRLAPALIAAGQATAAAHAMPLYIRDKVAQTTDERAAARANRNA